MKRSQAVLLFVSSLILMVGYTNCSQFKVADEVALSSTSVNQIFSGSSDVESEYQVVQANNRILAYQDRRFKFRIPGAANGANYQALNLPAWLSVDAVAGELTGIPTEMQVTSNLSISVTVGGQTQVAGPFTLEVLGNPLKAQQWHLKNLGQRAYAAAAGTLDQDVHADATIRDGVLGKGIRVAVSDSGVFEAHRNLAPNILANQSRNYLNNFAVTQSWLGNSTPATNSAANAHGTAVAGLIAERGWSNIGGRGIAPLASISGFLFIQAQTQLANTGYLTAGILDQFDGNFDVFNYSWGDSQCAFGQYPDSYFQKLRAGVTNLRNGRGAVYVMASGNDFYGSLRDCYANAQANATYIGNSNHSELNSSPYTILVAAVNADGNSASYSSPGANVWVSAPGGEYGLATNPNVNFPEYLQPALISTDFPGCGIGMKTRTAANAPFNAGANPNSACESVSTMNGTSGATPLVSGAVALMLNVNPNLTWRDVKHILATTADRVDANAPATAHPIAGSNLAGHVYQQGWVTNAAGFRFHNWYGFGRIHVDRAVSMARTYVSNFGPYRETGFVFDSGVMNAQAPANSATGITRTLNIAENLLVESVQVRVTMNNCIGNTGVEITSPAGTKSVLLNINSGLLETSLTNHVMLSNAFYGERSQGAWAIKVISGAANCQPVLNSWQLNIGGRN